MNTCEKCPESSDLQSISSDEATYMNTWKGYLDANDLRQAATIEASSVRTLLSNQSSVPNKSTCYNTCEGYLDDNDPCPATCGGPTMAVPILRLPWLASHQRQEQIWEADEHVLTLAILCWFMWNILVYMYINSHENAQTIYKDYLFEYFDWKKKTVSSDLHHKEVNNKKKSIIVIFYVMKFTTSHVYISMQSVSLSCWNIWKITYLEIYIKGSNNSSD